MTITREDDFGGAILNCAVRYALGRRSYMPGLVAVRYALGRRSYMPGLVMDEIRPMLKDCSNKTLWCFERDIDEWLNTWERDAGCYIGEWSAFLSDVRKELKRREGEKKQ